uniref:Caprin-1 n=1 Tax=Leptobrachium leishanense TaxID=445787 RepID=A0A8C5QQ74_9ANUR
MPSATSTKAVPGSSDAAAGTGTIQSEAMKQILGVIDKKIRNLEKKKGKLDDYQDRMNKGERLNQDQLDAVSKYQEVVTNMEFARELQRNFMSLGQDIQKSIKKAARREQLVREEAEQKRLKTILELQFLLDKLGDERKMAAVDEFYKLAQPERDPSVGLCEQYEPASVHLWDVLDGKDKPVCGTTYKALREVLERILHSGYFDSAQNQNHQNGLCEDEEVLAAPPAEEQAPELEPETVEEYAEPSEVESTEFVNRQFMTEAQYSSSSEKEQVDEWTVETVEVVNSLQQQASPSPVPEPLTLNAITQVPPDPIVRQQRVQDLMSMQTVFNMNAPVPPVNEPDTLKQQSQYQASYNQTFAGQPHQVEQSELQQEQLQTVVNTYHTPSDQSHQTSAGHQQATQQNTGFPRNNQPFYNNRGMARGGQRGSRGLINGYRGPSNGFRGGYDGYRPTFPNTPNSGYAQPQFSAPRDYSNNYQRDGYQQNFKRGAGQGGPRGAPRGNAQVMHA